MKIFSSKIKSIILNSIPIIIPVTNQVQTLLLNKNLNFPSSIQLKNNHGITSCLKKTLKIQYFFSQFRKILDY